MAKITIIPNTRNVTSSMKESNSSFICPSNSVMTGRYHTGDENGQTQYATAIVKLEDEKASVVELSGSTAIKESSGVWFKSDARSVITGRYHNHDENGYTIYYTGVITIASEGEITQHTVRGYTTKVESQHSIVTIYPEGDHYVSGEKIAYVYKLTYEIPNVKSDHFYQNESSNCGYESDPVYGGGFWNVKRNYSAEYRDNKIILTTFCVQLDGKTWYPCKPEEVEWSILLIE